MRAIRDRRAYNQAYREAHREQLVQQNREYYAAHREEHLAAARMYRQSHDEQIRAYRLAHRTERSKLTIGYRRGLNRGELSTLYAAQGGKCAVCGDPAPMQGVRGLFLDHDHDTGERRGLVCNRCNVGLVAIDRLGPSWVWRVINYLENPPLRRLRERAEP